MSRHFLLWGLFTHAVTLSVSGQAPIQLDRPDQTECPFIVPKKYIQVENGFTIEKVSASAKSYSYPSVLWKYGLTDKFEFRLITELVTEKEYDIKHSGLMPVTVGFKTNICHEKGIIPEISFIGHLNTGKIGSKIFQASNPAPAFRFTMQHTLSDKISLAYNLGAEWDGEIAEQTYIYTLTTGISFTEKLGGYLEIFGFVPKHAKADHSIDGGITCLLSNDFILDLSAGLGLTSSAPKNYISLGVSFRFNTMSNH